MIKFKNLLKLISEDRETERLKIPGVWKEELPVAYKSDIRGAVYEAIDLVKELNKDEWYTPKKESLLLYRGVSGWNQPWKIKNIRKDREPRDTRKWVDELVERVRSKYYSEVPSRRASKFAASSEKGKREVGNKYGHPHIIFPEADAPIYSISRDPMHFMNSITKSGTKVMELMNSITRNSLTQKTKKLRKKLVSDLKSRAPSVWKFAKELDSGEIDFSITKNPVEIERRANEARRHFYNNYEDEGGKLDDPVGSSAKMTLSDMFRGLCQFVGEIFDDIHAYFVNLSEGVVAESGEVMYSGDSFVRVEWRFWKFFIDYDFQEGKARLHQLVRSIADENSDQLQLNI